MRFSEPFPSKEGSSKETLVSLTKSPRQGKRYRAVFSDGKKIDFGSDVATTFVDGATEKTRQNYLKRHTANTREAFLIKNKVVSPALLAADLLWGKSRSLANNVAELNRKLK